MDASSEPAPFGLVGGAWRAEFFLRIARALPQRFEVVGAFLRDEAKRRTFEAAWGVPAQATLDALLERRPRFVVVSVPTQVAPAVLEALSERGVPALCETPPAPDLEGLIALHKLTERGARVQVAEQYAFQPLHAARLRVARSGKLGAVSQARVAVAHGYHAVSLIRAFLGVRFENARVGGQAFSSNLVAGPGRDGPPGSEALERQRTVLATLDFGDRLGVLDFAEWSQYFSWVRSHRVLVQGERGEITDERVRYLEDYLTPVQLDLVRRDTGHGGNLEGYHHVGVLAGSEWVYRNPFAPARLSDEEIAIATCLEKMAAYASGGESFYSLAEASQDHYLNLMVQQSLETGLPVETTSQVWASP